MRDEIYRLMSRYFKGDPAVTARMVVDAIELDAKAKAAEMVARAKAAVSQR